MHGVITLSDATSCYDNVIIFKGMSIFGPLSYEFGIQYILSGYANNLKPEAIVSLGVL